MPQWVKTGALVGGSALAGGLANRGTTQTATPTLSPELQALQGDLISSLQKRMADPAQGTEPLRLGLLESVNRNYRNLPNRVGTALAKRGMGRSGQMGAALKGVEMGRLGEISDVNTSMANTILGRQDSAMEMINRLLSSGRGMTSTGSGNVLGGAVGSGIGTLSTMLMLDKMLKGVPAGVVSAGGVPSAAAVNAGLPSVLETVGMGLPAAAGAGGLGVSALPSAVNWGLIGATSPGIAGAEAAAAGTAGASAGAGSVAGSIASAAGPAAVVAGIGYGIYRLFKSGSQPGPDYNPAPIVITPEMAQKIAEGPAKNMPVMQNLPPAGTAQENDLVNYQGNLYRFVGGQWEYLTGANTWPGYTTTAPAS